MLGLLPVGERTGPDEALARDAPSVFWGVTREWVNLFPGVGGSVGVVAPLGWPVRGGYPPGPPGARRAASGS